MTGATGHIENVLVRELLRRGEKVRVLISPDECRAPLTGKHFFKMKVPFDLAAFARCSLEVLRSNSNISHAKATDELGYQPRPLYESIRDAVKWFLEKN